MSEKPYWWPELTDAAWCQRIRDEYEDAADMDDETIRDMYADGYKYADTWDHLGDAREEYEAFADAFLKHVSRYDKMREALLDATSHLAGAVSAYEAYAGNVTRPGGRDPLFNTRLRDFKNALLRVRETLKTTEGE